jgi:hypothetical protein
LKRVSPEYPGLAQVTFSYGDEHEMPFPCNPKEQNDQISCELLRATLEKQELLRKCGQWSKYEKTMT